MTTKKKVLIGCGVLAGLLVVAIAGLIVWMQLVRYGYLRFNKWDHRERGTLEVGSPVADLELPAYSGENIHLASLWKNRPLFLVFGSCT